MPYALGRILIAESEGSTMSKKVILTFDKSQNDIPVLCVAEEYTSLFPQNSTIRIDRFITGDDATRTWELLTGKKRSSEIYVEANDND